MPEAKINYAPETCALCGGTGKSRWPLLYDYCPACGGTGWAHALRE